MSEASGRVNQLGKVCRWAIKSQRAARAMRDIGSAEELTNALDPDVKQKEVLPAPVACAGSDMVAHPFRGRRRSDETETLHYPEDVGIRDEGHGRAGLRSALRRQPCARRRLGVRAKPKPHPAVYRRGNRGRNLAALGQSPPSFLRSVPPCARRTSHRQWCAGFGRLWHTPDRPVREIDGTNALSETRHFVPRAPADQGFNERTDRRLARQ